MNDFSKDELIKLKRLALHNVNMFRQNSDCIELMGKIQSIIDNYCEHEPTTQDSVLVTFCLDCDWVGFKE